MTDQWIGVARLLADMPESIERLSAEHVPDRNGRCRACTTPGRGTPHDPWPCSMANLAKEALKIRRNR